MRIAKVADLYDGAIMRGGVDKLTFSNVHAGMRDF
jgi:hypothetical protein